MRRTLQRRGGSAVQRYLPFDVDGERTWLPMVRVRLRGATGTWAKTAALVDSGSTATFVPPELAEIIGLRPTTPSGASGAGGEFDTNLAGTTIEVLTGGQVAATMKCEVHVPVDRGRIPFVVLGRDTIFLRYDITFRENQGILVLQRPRRRAG